MSETKDEKVLRLEREIEELKRWKNDQSEWRAKMIAEIERLAKGQEKMNKRLFEGVHGQPSIIEQISFHTKKIHEHENRIEKGDYRIQSIDKEQAVAGTHTSQFKKLDDRRWEAKLLIVSNVIFVVVHILIIATNILT